MLLLFLFSEEMEQEHTLEMSFWYVFILIKGLNIIISILPSCINKTLQNLEKY